MKEVVGKANARGHQNSLQAVSNCGSEYLQEDTDSIGAIISAFARLPNGQRNCCASEKYLRHDPLLNWVHLAQFQGISMAQFFSKGTKLCLEANVAPPS